MLGLRQWIGARSSVRIEQRFPKPLVGGSSPLGRTIQVFECSGTPVNKEKLRVTGYGLLITSYYMRV